KGKQIPIRCTRCQNWGHIAQDCRSPRDTCTTCGHEHPTENCTSCKTHHCISCGVNDHSSNDQHCLTYEEKCADINIKYPENSVPFF
ncbi:hypothetical protein BDN67DRAFT_874776, partial [Paxillus ammoniavirescens]